MLDNISENSEPMECLYNLDGLIRDAYNMMQLQ